MKIIEYAKYLGVDPLREPQLLRIAQVAGLCRAHGGADCSSRKGLLLRFPTDGRRLRFCCLLWMLPDVGSSTQMRAAKFFITTGRAGRVCGNTRSTISTSLRCRRGRSDAWVIAERKRLEQKKLKRRFDVPESEVEFRILVPYSSSPMAMEGVRESPAIESPACSHALSHVRPLSAAAGPAILLTCTCRNGREALVRTPGPDGAGSRLRKSLPRFRTSTERRVLPCRTDLLRQQDVTED
eukprot:481784-Hanusia_phi.AAC.7